MEVRKIFVEAKQFEIKKKRNIPWRFCRETFHHESFVKFSYLSEQYISNLPTETRKLFLWFIVGD